ncbi:hypothetical protein Pmar_PMAR020707 [Perkinsus marinus ATCC 50983]|nr:hypothetical protein Pmar_PMAR020707 [Perkinsus marinus ATCC 50983]EER01470.1 hypothetical protein Pmar_PMAR020707 [Perkinsus marinus ATCC 50983]|eukprot:XP_002768752.1 hypothetical protein Pmar_PMAR020707 [Perkinsus marinus ATCC 50983]
MVVPRYVEKINEVPVPQVVRKYVDKIIEETQVQRVERVVEVPQVQTVDRYVEVNQTEVVAGESKKRNKQLETIYLDGGVERVQVRENLNPNMLGGDLTHSAQTVLAPPMGAAGGPMSRSQRSATPVANLDYGMGMQNLA